MLPRLQILIASTRPGRVGPAIAQWFHAFAAKHGGFDPHLVDLAELALPIYDEPNHPMRRQYTKDHTKTFSEIVKAADATVFVTPEYNYSPPPSLVNAIDYLYWEWQYMPAGVVSYGGVSGGLRSAQAIRLMVSTLKMMPLPEGVALPNVFNQIKDGAFVANDLNEQGAGAMLNEMRKWTDALAGLRDGIRRQ
ncbi:MAG: NAD(P)H-dependent oxidoreductase [Alphaproteobacteria bacterium]|nr:NAD(P)H-dependent oxidoreductase [Alphaproteobacteria bacterium]